MKEKGIISVIVPVYNVKQFLPQCLESIIKQTYARLQIIVIDDGSTDGSAEICDEFADKDKRIKVFHQKNQGVSAARNLALAHASGEFISFVDSDDVLPEDALAYEISQIGIADLLVCKSQKILENGKRIPTERELPKKIFSKEEMLWYLFDEERFGYLGYLCDKLYKTQIIKEKNILFDEKIRLNEDRLFLVEYVSYCKKIQLNNKVGYYYRQRLESAIGETRKRVTAGELTVIESFERMKALTRVDFSKVYYLICRRTFECGFTLYNRIPRKEKRIRQHLTSVMWKNALLYIQSPDLQMIDKIKVICHCLIKR